MVIRTNVASLCAYREYKKTARATAKNLEKLASGYRINRSADDASGLSMSERMRANITELDRCENNATEGVKLAKTADGALAEVNDMLRRARELCIQAENGTYSEQELASISDEMNELFSEIDRITEGSRFNEIQLFRGQQGADFHYEYDETFTPVDGGLETWGDMDFVDTKPFDDPPQAKAATATFKLDGDVDFGDVSSLNGRAIKVGNYTYYFTDGTVNIPSDYYSRTISLTTYTSTGTALQAFAQQVTNNESVYMPNDPHPEIGRFSVAIDTNAHTITLTNRLTEKDDGEFEAIIDGAPATVYNEDIKGSGAWANGKTAAQNIPGTASLEQVDGQGIANNTPTYSDTATASFSLDRFPDTLTDYYVKNLKGNTLEILSRKIALGSLNPPVSAGMSRDSFGNSLANAITGGNYEATYDSATKRVNITLKNQSTNSGWTGSISEDTTDPDYDTDSHEMFKSTGLNLSAVCRTPASAESSEVWEVTVPTTTAPFSFKVGNTNYLYYDSSKNSLKRTDDTSTSYSSSLGGSMSTPPVDVNGKNREAILENIAGKLAGLTGVRKAEVQDGKIIVTALGLNNKLDLDKKLGSPAITVTGSHTITKKEGTSAVMGLGTTYFYKTATVPFDLGSDISKLAGSGFSIDGAQWEFCDGAGIPNGINVSGITDFTALEEAIQQKMGTSYKVKIDTSDSNNAKLLISKSVRTTVTVKDGMVGIKNLISGDEPVKYSGGSDIGYSETKIDFSSVNSDNLNDLLGKGFRINCATCEGEYINVFFCWENDGRAPENFEIEVNGVKRTIPNIAVELSKVTSGDQIVQSIVDQVRPMLKHFTDVDVGSPATTLIARDKRLGGAKPDGINFKPAEVVTGLETNFTYSVNIRKVDDLPADGAVVMKNNNVDIYVGSEPNPQIIPIHLPYIDLKTLRLRPPETVDLNADDQNASDWLNRVDTANLAISEFRGVIGADFNRLEHAVKQLSSAHVDLADAESRIRDADMAEEMMEHVKLQILTQAQQGMLAQANSRPQQILQLIS